MKRMKPFLSWILIGMLSVAEIPASVYGNDLGSVPIYIENEGTSVSMAADPNDTSDADGSTPFAEDNPDLDENAQDSEAFDISEDDVIDNSDSSENTEETSFYDGTVLQDEFTQGNEPYEGEFDSFQWSYDTISETLTITGIGDMTYISDCPWSNFKENVKKVVFSEGITGIVSIQCPGILEVELPSTLKTIANSTFYGSAITEITLPYGLETIGNYSFYNCTALKEIEIPDSVKTIGEKAFYGAGLIRAKIGDGVVRIEDRTFCCDNLEEIVLGESVSYLGHHAINSRNLTELTLPASLTKLEESSVWASKLSILRFMGRVPSINQWVDDHTINPMVVGIHTDENEITVYYPDRFETSWKNQENTLKNKSSLSSWQLIVYTRSVRFISFAAAYAHNKTTWDLTDGVLTISGTGEMNDYTTWLDPLTPWHTLKVADQVEKVVIEEGVTSVGANAFAEMPNLEQVELASTVTTIRPAAFRSSPKLKTINLPNQLGSIGYEAFYGDRQLDHITLPATVTSLGEGVFAFCEHLSDLTVEAGNPSYVLDNNILYSTDKTIIYASSNQLSGAVRLPETVDSIMSGAFSARNNLTSMNLAGVTSIGEYVFAGSEELRTITYPALNINNRMFEGCISLEEISFAGSFDKVRDAAFKDCRSLESLNLGMIALIGASAFSGCSSLSSITFSSLSSGTIIESRAFEDTILLTDVYYDGTKSGYEEMVTIKSNNEYLRVANIHCTDGTIIHKVSEQTAVTKEISYKSGKITLDYDEADLTATSYTYNHHLSTFMAALATLAYADNPDDTLKVLTKTLGYQDAVFIGDAMTDGSGSPVFIAHKQVQLKDGLAEILLIDVKGTVEKEWINDFEIGLSGSIHSGFNSGKEYVYSGVKAYLEEWIKDDKFNKDANIKILLTGHSRGAAVCNLLGKQFDEDQKIITTGGRVLYLKRKDIFTYTFATPNTNSWDTSGISTYNNIFNIVNPEDFVTKVVPSAWGFGRYGITYVLPSKTTDRGGTDVGYVDYESYLAELQKNFRTITGGEEYKPYEDGMITVSSYVSDLTKKVKTQRAYYKYDLLTGLESEINSGFTMYSLFRNGLGKLLSSISDITHVHDLPESANNLAASLFGQYGEVGYRTLFYFITNLNAFANAHQPETYLSGLMFLTEKQIKTPRVALRGIVNCPVDVTVTDSAGRVVGRITDNKVDESISSGEGAILMIVDGDSKQFWLPGDGVYTVMLSGNDAGVMDYSLCSMDADRGEAERVCYKELPVEIGKVMTQEVDENKELTELRLVDAEQNEIAMDRVISADDQGNLEVQVKVEGAGRAGSFVNLNPGDYVTLTAEPDGDNKFSGWFDSDGKLVSERMVYSFTIYESITLTAKFTDLADPSSGQVFFTDVTDPTHPYYKAIYWAANAGITKGYSDGTFGIDRSCTRGEMMMFLWKFAKKPQPKTVSKSPFKDVSKTHAFYKAILWGYQKGITKGYADGTFGINRSVTRGEAMMFLWKLKKKPTPGAASSFPFRDVPKTHAFYKAILWGYQHKITKGYTSGTKKGMFGINDACTRGQIVTFLYKSQL